MPTQQDSSRRKDPRIPLAVQAHVRVSKHISVPCVISNISKGGAQLRLGVRTKLPTRFVLEVTANVRIERRCVLRWHNGSLVGVRFVFDRKKLFDQPGLGALAAPAPL